MDAQHEEFTPREVLDALHEVRTRAPMSECGECADELAQLTGVDAAAVMRAPFERDSELERALEGRPEVTGQALGVVTRYLGAAGTPPAY